MSLETKNTNELEDIIVEMMIGGNPTMSTKYNIKDVAFNEKINRFVTWAMESDRIKKELKEKYMSEFNGIDDGIKGAVWLDWYKGILIREIRDMKLNRLI